MIVTYEYLTYIAAKHGVDVNRLKVLLVAREQANTAGPDPDWSKVYDNPFKNRIELTLIEKKTMTPEQKEALIKAFKQAAKHGKGLSREDIGQI
jgi:hypothetical protein